MRDSVRWQAWIALLAGAWLFVAPWLFTFTSAGAWNAHIVGAVIALLALAALATRSGAIALFLAVLGAWAFIAPFLFGGGGGVRWSAWIVGIVTLLMAGLLIGAPGRRRNPRTTST